MIRSKTLLLGSLSLLMSSSLLLGGCTNSTQSNPETSTETSIVTTEENTSITNTEEFTSIASTEEPTTTVETKALTISILNQSEVNIGIFSAIDPATQEQYDLSELNSGETKSFECNWPVNTQEFNWAVYDTNGNLCLEASTNISEVKDEVILVLSGTDTMNYLEIVHEQ